MLGGGQLVNSETELGLAVVVSGGSCWDVLGGGQLVDSETELGLAVVVSCGSCWDSADFKFGSTATTMIITTTAITRTCIKTKSDFRRRRWTNPGERNISASSSSGHWGFSASTVGMSFMSMKRYTNCLPCEEIIRSAIPFTSGEKASFKGGVLLWYYYIILGMLFIDLIIVMYCFCRYTTRKSGSVESP